MSTMTLERKLDLEKTYFYPSIDYRAHPAFVMLDVPPRADDEQIEAMIDRIDASLGQLHAERHPDRAAIERAFASGAGALIDELEAYLERTAATDRQRRRFEHGFVETREELLAEATILNARKIYREPLDAPLALETYNDLSRTGARTFRIDEGTMQRLRKLTAPQQQSLREKAAREPHGRFTENFARYSDVGVLVQDMFERNGVLEGLSAYVGSNTVFAGLALEYSHDRQTWWKGCYADIGLPDSRTIYMHYDHGCKNPKAIVALYDVDEANGPTSYIRGSNREARSNFTHFLVKSFEQTFYEDYTNDTGSRYYRRMFAEVEHRRDFLTLPRALQACTHFGEDILDDTPLSRELLSREVKLTRDIGNCVVFDGDYGVHRGALVRQGERFALQIIFNIEPSPSLMKAFDLRSRFLVKRVLGMRR